MSQPQFPVSLFYRAKWRKDVAARIAEGLPEVVRFRESRHFNGSADVEFKVAKVNMPPVNYDRVLVLDGSPQQEAIVREYGEWGVEVEVVSEGKPPADDPGPPGERERPDFKSMKKADLRQLALKEYGYNVPLSMKVAELREWLEGQPWPPRVPQVAEKAED